MNEYPTGCIRHKFVGYVVSYRLSLVHDVSAMTALFRYTSVSQEIIRLAVLNRHWSSFLSFLTRKQSFLFEYDESGSHLCRGHCCLMNRGSCIYFRSSLLLLYSASKKCYDTGISRILMVLESYIERLIPKLYGRIRNLAQLTMMIIT